MAHHYGVVLCGALLLSVAIVRADAPPSTPVSDAEIDALLHEVYTLRVRHEDVRALEKAEQAYALRPSPWVLVQLALAESGAGHWARAYSDLRRALSEHGDPRVASYRLTLEAELRAMEARVAQLSLSVEPPVAAVYIDGQPQAETPLSAPLVVDPGSVLLEIRAAGHETQRVTLQLNAGEHVRWSFVLRPQPRPAELADSDHAMRGVAATTSAARKTDSSARATGYVLAAASVVFIAGTIITGIMAHDRTGDFNAQNVDPARTKSERDRARRSASAMQWVNTGLLGAAVVTAGISGYLLLTPPSVDASNAARGPGMGVALRGKF